jgi:hypothetical protein
MNALQFSRQRTRILRSQRPAGWQDRAMRKLIEQARAIPLVSAHSIIGWRLPTMEVVCAKRRYPDHERAVSDMLAIQAEYGKDGRPRRAYQCPFCDGWHLTSRISGEAHASVR